jgi:threonylcarbamoyladenosine tRNA methylthiotransferase MtaB
MKVFLDTVGCRLNQSEIEIMAGQFRAAGHEIVATPDLAELAVVNTCAVTTAAVSDSRGRIRSISRAGVKRIVPTGCWATMQPEQAAALTAVTDVIANPEKDELVLRILDQPKFSFERETLSRVPLPGPRHRTRAFIKAQDGCDNHCTFCVTTVARGRSRSRSVADIIADIKSALAGGTNEIVLTGVHLGSWGAERDLHLRELIHAVLQDTDTPRLRLSSLEPWDLDEPFFDLWENPRLMPHLHLPLQSGSAVTLRRMARRITPESFRKLIQSARERIRDVAITTDLIAGFPGESEQEFDESLAFIRAQQFAGGHVFTFSPRPGTAAASFPKQIPHVLRKQRNHILYEALAESAAIYRKRFLGRTLQVLWESASSRGENGWEVYGLTENSLRVVSKMASPRWNEIDQVKMIELRDQTLAGVIWNSG